MAYGLCGSHAISCDLIVMLRPTRRASNKGPGTAAPGVINSRGRINFELRHGVTRPPHNSGMETRDAVTGVPAVPNIMTQ